MGVAERRGRTVLAIILGWVLIGQAIYYAVVWSSGAPVTSGETVGEVFKTLLSLYAVVALLRGWRGWFWPALVFMLVRGWTFGDAAWAYFAWEPDPDRGPPRFGQEAGPVFVILSVGYLTSSGLLLLPGVSKYMSSVNPGAPSTESTRAEPHAAPDAGTKDTRP